MFLTYARAIGLPSFILFIMMYVVFMGVNVFSNTWLSYWTEDKTLNNMTVQGNSSLRKEKNDFYFGIYGGLGVVQGKPNIKYHSGFFFAQDAEIATRISTCMYISGSHIKVSKKFLNLIASDFIIFFHVS